MAPREVETWTLKIRIATLITLLGGFVTIGIMVGDWRAWRKDATEKITKAGNTIEEHSKSITQLQDAQNAKQRIHNDHAGESIGVTKNDK